MYQVEYDPFYELELEQILADIVSDYTVDFAHQVIYEINNHIENIKQMPKMYAVYGNIPTYRKFIVKRKYTVFYVIDEDRQVVIIAHIFPSMRDLPNLLN